MQNETFYPNHFIPLGFYYFIIPNIVIVMWRYYSALSETAMGNVKLQRFVDDCRR